MNSIEEILEDLRAGKMIVLVDDESRENEGDLVCAAEKVTPQIINFMRKHAGGQICLPMTNTKADQLALYPQASDNTSRFGTAFTVSVDAATGVTTGISAADRARTIQVACRDDAKTSDLVRPGHMFPLCAGRRVAGAGGADGRIDRPGAAGGPEADGGDLRDHERRRHDGAAGRSGEVLRNALRCECARLRTSSATACGASG